MKVLIMLNGITHYFNHVVNKINEQPDIEVLYIIPSSKSAAIGEGVFETREGINFELISLDEKTDSNGHLYYAGLIEVLQKHQPSVLMLGDPNLAHLINNAELMHCIKTYKIRLALKSIPFRVDTYEDAIARFWKKQSTLELPSFKSLPSIAGAVLNKLGVNRLYKKWFLDPKAYKQFLLQLEHCKKMYNAVDGHLNYIEEGKDIYGSYGVPASKIFVTYNSPDTDYYFSVKEKIKALPPILPSNPYRIIHLSRLVEWKRVDMLVRAIAHLKKDYPQAELLVIGNGPEEDKLKQLAVKLEVADRIQFLGGIYDAELFGRYIMASSIYVLAGMGGLSINDAMIFGLPVICSVCDGTEKYLVKEGYNGLYFKEGDQQDLEAKIARLFSEPELRTTMGKNSETIIREQINIQTVVNRYVHAFKTIAAS